MGWREALADWLSAVLRHAAFFGCSLWLLTTLILWSPARGRDLPTEEAKSKMAARLVGNRESM